MHYTSIENIHKVIDPLFLDDLKSEFAEIKEQKQINVRNKRLQAFQKKIAGLTFLDPACGSGNFLTETYLSLRRIENEILKIFYGNQMVMDLGDVIKVSIGQFYGIEINDFAVTVAKTALWIAESQMMKATEDIVHTDLDFLPLKSYANIVEGNALCLDWNDVIPKEKLNYIMGNPPFVGYSLQTKEQKEDLLSIYVDDKGKPYKTAGKIDYVSGWYFKAAQLMQNTEIKTAFVSTNSITQGEQVASVWKPLYDRFGINIDFAYRTFRWDSEASIKAHVHCVIVGFSCEKDRQVGRIFDESGIVVQAKNISPYLIDGDNIFVESRNTPLCKIPEMIYGSKPTDGGFLLLSEEEKNMAVNKEPSIEKYIHKFLGADEFIKGKKRYCLWLEGASPADIHKSVFLKNRVQEVYEFRISSSKMATKASASKSHLFQEIRQSKHPYILVPAHTAGTRQYIPMGFESADTICGNANLSIPDASIFHFGVLMSSTHMAWMRMVCGRLGEGYRYSASIVYNNFPWANVTESQKIQIEKTAQGILDARSLYPDSSLADMYDKATMPIELRKAHQANDRAVMKAYGFTPSMPEPEIVAELMKRYQEMTK